MVNGSVEAIADAVNICEGTGKYAGGTVTKSCKIWFNCEITNMEYMKFADCKEPWAPPKTATL